MPLIGQPSRTLITRLERGEITIESDLSQTGADALINRLAKMGITAFAQKKQSFDELDLDMDLDFDLEAIFLPQETALNNAIPEVQPSSPTEDANPWETLFPDLETTQPDQKIQSKKKPPSLGELENGRMASPSSPPQKTGRQQPRTAESMMRDIIPTVNRPPFYPDGFDDTYEHSPELAAIFSIMAPGAGHRYNGEDELAQSAILSGVFLLPWFRSIKKTRQSAQKIQSYHLKRPADGALNRTLVHITLFWLVIGVVTSLANFTYHQFAQHSELEKSEKKIAGSQIREAITSARLKHAEARFAGVEGVRAHLSVEPKQGISMTPQEHIERLYAVGVQRCKARQYSQCQGIMSRVSKLKAGYRDVLVLQTWASQQRTSDKRIPIPEISEVKTLEQIDAPNE